MKDVLHMYVSEDCPKPRVGLGPGYVSCTYLLAEDKIEKAFTIDEDLTKPTIWVEYKRDEN